MPIQNIPESYFAEKVIEPDFFIYDFKMTEEVVKSKVNLTMNMFSFLQTGHKKVHIEESFLEINNKQSILIKAGNCLFTEVLDIDKIYFCKLFFFSNKSILNFLDKYASNQPQKLVNEPNTAFFVIENDSYIDSFITSITNIFNLNTKSQQQFLALKFEEIMLYLSEKYGNQFILFLKTIASNEQKSLVKKIVEANAHSNLSLNEIAFLTNMSLSTFKRHFAKEFNTNPGTYLKQKRLEIAKKLLEEGNKKPTEIFKQFGYSSLSNFSIAFKNEFGYSPKMAFDR
jgi:AraC family transcriptional regulator, exoenzyme S synthesis regulatory protein ExsA